MPTQKLALAEIQTRDELQPRIQMNIFIITDYADAMREGRTFPPIEVVWDGSTYWLWDGFHRTRAAKQAGLVEIEVNITEGTKEDAEWLALSANRTHGLRRSNEDKRRAVELALKHPKAAGLSNYEIALHCGVSDEFVRKMKPIYQPLVDKSLPRTVNRNGSSYTMNTANIGKRIELDSTQIHPQPQLNLNGYIDKVIDECDQHYLTNQSDAIPYYQNQQVTVYNCHFGKVLPSINDGLFIFDPPYNIGFEYDVYQDNLPDEVYIEMLSRFRRFSKVVVIQYPEEMQRLVVPALGVPDHCSAWCYNSNTSRRFRLINWYGVTPDYSRIKQPYKNPTDRRVAELIANGNEGTDLYEWWTDIQIVKNVSLEKTKHPCPVPEALIKRIITLGADPEDVIIDPFAGSLTTLKAAQDLGYRAIGMEISESYIEDGLHRLKQFNFSTAALG